jgi:hypothetical protein
VRHSRLKPGVEGIPGEQYQLTNSAMPDWIAAYLR